MFTSVVEGGGGVHTFSRSNVSLRDRSRAVCSSSCAAGLTVEQTELFGGGGRLDICEILVYVFCVCVCVLAVALYIICIC